MSNTSAYEAKLKAQRWIEPLLLGPKDVTPLSRDMGFVVKTLSDLSAEVARLKKVNAALRDRRQILKQKVMATINPRELAERIADAAGEGAIDVYRTASGAIRWHAAGGEPLKGAEFIGTYDEGCDVRLVQEDLTA